MRKISRKAISICICTFIVLITLVTPVFAASSDYTVTVSADAESVKQGDVLTVNVTVSGAQFCAVDAELSYDTESFEYVSSRSGWSNDGQGRLRYVAVYGSDGYWDDGKVIGTFKFLVKDTAPAGEAAFAIGKDREVFIVGDWAEGASPEKAKPLEGSQLVSTAVTVIGEKGDNEPLTGFGAISDDGNTVNMEAGYHIYSIPDTDNEQVVWKSSDEKIVTVDEDGLVTAVSDGSAVITAQDKNGNELEQRTIIVGDMPKAESTEDVATEQTPKESEGIVDDVQNVEDAATEQTSGEPASNDDAGPDTWIVIVIVAAVVVVGTAIAAAVILSKKRKAKTK